MARKSKKKLRTRRKTKSVKPIPTGFRTVTAYLVVNNGSGAIDFYKRAFGAKELTKNATPDGKIMNSQIKIGDSIVMISDEFPGSNTKSPSSLGTSTVTLHLYTKNVDKLWAQAVSSGASVAMALENQFWGERYGQLVDPFGHHWSLSQRIKMSPKEMEEKQKAAMAMFAQAEPPGTLPSATAL
ncbi:MAG: VOC family protein [Nitrososphaerales archaeon]